ncbi:MAG: hypothetical protein KA163_02005 [Bacteroidia bacterium]|nr:hypothetical protein [Bacteroidia bacterium]
MHYIFLDTNIFLHFKAYTEIPWGEIINSNEYTLVIDMVVLQELDKHKNHQNKKIARKAKETIARFEKIVDNSPTDIKITIHRSAQNNETFEKNILSKLNPDDCIIASMIDFEINNTDSKTIITNDLSIKTKAKLIGLNSIRLNDKYRLEEELSEEEKIIKDLQNELKEFKHRSPKVNLSFKGGTNVLNHKIDIPNLDRSEFIEKELKIIKRRYSYWKKKEESKKTLGAISALTGISDKQIEDYNKELDKFYFEYQSFLARKYNYKEYLTTCIKIDLYLENIGTLPAEDMDVYFHFPDGFELVEDLEKEPQEPMPPYQPKSLWDLGPGLSLNPDIFKSINQYERLKNIPYTGPSLTGLKKTNSYDVTFTLPNLKHNENVLLGRLYACYDTTESMKNFEVDYSITIANFPKKVEGKLHVIIENKQPK